MRSTMSKIRCIICIILSVILMTSSFTALAKTKAQLQSDLNSTSKQKKEIQARIDKLKGEGKSVLTEKNRIDGEIALVQDDIDELQTVIDETESNIVKKEADIAVVQGEIAKYNEVFKIRVRVMYENQNADYLEILLSSKSLSDFLLKMDLITQILTNDKEILTTMASNKKKLVDDKAVLVDAKESNESAKAIVVEKKQALKEKSDEQQAVMDQLKQEEQEGKQDLKRAEADERELAAQIRSIEESESKKSSPSIPRNYTGGKFLWPSDSRNVTSSFGRRSMGGTSESHTGIDISASYGTPIYAAADGVVILAKKLNYSYGNHLVISHGSGYSTLYAHASSLLVNVGDSVKRGQIIAKTGSTGRSTGPHLHFEIRINSTAQNPMNYF